MIVLIIDCFAFSSFSLPSIYSFTFSVIFDRSIPPSSILISDKIGYEEIDFGSGIVSASIVRNFKNSVKQKVESITIDEVCKNLNKLNFIKIDIEGAELKALKGAEKTLNNYV